MTRDFDAISKTEERTKIIKNMKSEGLSAEQIARYIGTDINEVLPFFENK